MPVQPPLQTRNRKPLDPVAQCRDLLHLHLAFSPHEKQVDVVAETAFQRLGNRHGRVDMAPRSAARKNDFFHILSFFQYFFTSPTAPAPNAAKISSPIPNTARISVPARTPRKSAAPRAAVQRAVADRLGDILRRNLGVSGQVGDRPRHLQDRS